MASQRGQGTVEWIATVLVVALAMLGLVAGGVRVPGADLARSLAGRILCAAAMADGCGDEPTLIAAYGSEVGALVRRHMPMIGFETGSRALPVDFRRCRRVVCADGWARGLVHRTDKGLPVTAFVHVVDCREGRGERSEDTGADCSGERAGSLYIQYWLYYANSATLRGVPVAGEEGYHPDDWESVQIRIGPDGEAAERASSHNGYSYVRSTRNWGSDAALGPLGAAVDALGLRPANGWGPETHLLLVSGGSHAGAALDTPEGVDRYIPGRRVHLIPLEPIAEQTRAWFAVSPPWRKQVWRDPEATGTS
ncbi:MAG TPA: hypothetical protein VFI17_02025 [Solirubrobacterales bacterium]|nr:hypothetical protein [Solirubrobacterales bacterium]